jgi:hypothetical protein
MIESEKTDHVKIEAEDIFYDFRIHGRAEGG